MRCVHLNYIVLWFSSTPDRIPQLEKSNKPKISNRMPYIECSYLPWFEQACQFKSLSLKVLSKWPSLSNLKKKTSNLWERTGQESGPIWIAVRFSRSWSSIVLVQLKRLNSERLYSGRLQFYSASPPFCVLLSAAVFLPLYLELEGRDTPHTWITNSRYEIKSIQNHRARWYIFSCTLQCKTSLWFTTACLP